MSSKNENGALRVLQTGYMGNGENMEKSVKIHLVFVRILINNHILPITYRSIILLYSLS